MVGTILRAVPLVQCESHRAVQNSGVFESWSFTTATNGDLIYTWNSAIHLIHVNIK